MIIFEAMLVPGRSSSGMRSSKAPTWAAGPAGSKLSEEPEDDEHGNSREARGRVQHLSHQMAPSRAKLTIIFEAMLVRGHFPSGEQSPKAPTWAAGSARSKLSEEPEDDEQGNSERLGAELNASHTKRPLVGRS